AAVAQPLPLACARVLLGGLMLCLLSLACGRGSRFLRSRDALCAGVCSALNQIGFFMAMDSVGVALGTMIVIGSSIVMAGLFGAFLGERPSRLWWTAAALGIAGSVLAASGGESMAFRLDGLFFGLLGGLGYAAIGVFLKRMGRAGLSPTESNGAALLYGGLILLPLALRGDLGWLLTSRGSLSVLALGLLATAVPYFCFAVALARISVAQSYAISLLEPVTAALLGVFLLGERLNGVQALGMALEFACMVLSGRDAVRRSE
ncbi:MAG: EamA family transporter, partial [Pyramidobacter sp.]|nr:EamA family transporter [Pyramidobacter sp.]